MIVTKAAFTRLKAIGWNKRVLTEVDFYACCERDGVIVGEGPLSCQGMYLMRRGFPVILLNHKLVGVERQIVQWHEYGHHLLHAPGTDFFSQDTTDKQQFEANVVAACALIPRPIFQTLPFSDLGDEFGYPQDLISLRIRAWQQLRI
jgi:Zn-dependent peptidase ImmA (M78 family)